MTVFLSGPTTFALTLLRIRTVSKVFHSCAGNAGAHNVIFDILYLSF